ncbi:Lead, cadmium, zinc and mercury transporting ATPase [Rhodovulum sp. PH10]|uniref:heavy metal translocating P-type ATPase n=1 Tax=Rhodovulum sp. PH10 TaxID=1187851 RepID=UPI00027C2B3F|nr:heavy metal translocating P-type ATPase [Rhodovulum sp. PH10]EJW12107.1 Lead, cadmium, zinc and mercury transporting ATPase [Rhodovulum sp. PH10]
MPTERMPTERLLRWGLVAVAIGGLAAGLIASLASFSSFAHIAWTAGTLPVLVALAVSIVRDLAAGRMGVDAVAFVSMTAALVLGEPLAACVVAIMYAGGNVLEAIAVARAERDLGTLIDRAPRIAHRRTGEAVRDVPVDEVAIGDIVVVRAGEVVPVDGQPVGDTPAMLDESALTGEPLPVARKRGEEVRSGTVNAGETFEMRATATAGESTYAGIVRMVAAAQTAKAPFIRIADRFALLLLPATLLLAGGAWFFTGDPIRALAVLVASTPCPLILAAPVAFVAGVSQAARHGILVKGGGALEALARTHTVMFDKTGTLTVGGARLVAIETAPGESPDTVLRLAASLEQASHHVVAGAIVAAAGARDLALSFPEEVSESFGSGLTGRIDGETVCIGSQAMVFGTARPPDWAARAARRASWRSALVVFVAAGGRPVGALLLADELRRETPRAIQMLRTAGIARIMMVTGDRADAAETIGAALDLDAVLADRLPTDKVDAVATEQRLHPTLMVGDGLNDAPALAAAGVGVAMGARGASASSEAADVVILVDRLDRVSQAVGIARRATGIATQSIVAGMVLSGLAMGAAAAGWLSPVAAALVQEAIDVAVILNALRALGPGHRGLARLMKSEPPLEAQVLREEHAVLERSLDRLRAIADALDDADPAHAVALIADASRIVEEHVVEHERDDETSVYPTLTRHLADAHGLSAMSRAHREIQHLARLLARLAAGLEAQHVDRYLVRDAQRVIESVEALVRLHNAQEEDIYEHAVAA